MASSKELSDQINFATELNEVLGKVSTSVEKIERTFRTTTSSLAKMSTDAKDASDQLSNVAGGFDKFEEAAKKGLTGTTSGLQNVSNAAKQTSGSFERLAKKAIIATTAINALRQGFKNTVAISKSLVGLIGGLTSTVFEVSAAILAIPLKIFKALFDEAINSAHGGTELAEAIEAVRKQFGDLKGPGASAVIDTAKTFKGFSDTGLSAFRVFGNLAEALNHVREVATEMGASFDLVKEEFRDNGGAVLAYQKGLGVANEQMGSLARLAIVQGRKMSAVMNDIAKQSLTLGESFGIDQKLIARDMSKAAADVKSFGGASISAIGKAAVYARKLGVELEKIVGTLEAFKTFDQAAENASKLSQAFGVQLDTLKLMEAQDPAEQVDMLRKQFRAAGVDASKFTRQQLELLSATTGLDAETTRLAFSMNNQGKSLDQIRRESDRAQKKQMTQAEAMAKLADSIERLVKPGSLQGITGFFDAFVKGFAKGIYMSRDFQMILWNIRKSVMVMLNEGMKLGRFFVKEFPGVQQLFKALQSAFDPTKFKVFATALREGFEFIFKGGSVKQAIQNVRNAFSVILDPAVAINLKEGAMKFGSALSKIVAEAIKFAVPEITKGLRFIIDVLTGRKKIGAPNIKGPVTSFVDNIVMPIVSAIKDVWPAFSAAIGDLLKVAFSKLKGWAKRNEGAIRAAGTAVIGALFGPAVIQGLLVTIIPKMFSTLFSSIPALLKSLGPRVGQMVVGALGPVAIAAVFAASTVAISNGIEKYEKKITSTSDKASKKIGAAMTGIVDGITFGLLPPDLSLKIANAISKVYDEFFRALNKRFGTAGTTLKETMMESLNIMKAIGDAIKALIDGDSDRLGTALGDFMKSFVKYLWKASKFAMFEIPKIVGELGKTFVTGLFKSIGEWFKTTVLKIKDLFKGNLKDAFVDAVSSASSLAVSEMQTLPIDKFTESLQKKADAAAGNTASANEGIGSMINEINSVGSQIGEAITNATEISKKAPELKAAFDGMKSVISSLGLDVVDPKVLAQVANTNIGIGTLMSSVTMILSFMEKIGDLQTISDGVNKKGTASVIAAVQKMVGLANELDDSLADGRINKIDAVAKLEKVANAVGMGAKGSFTIQNKMAQITVNLKVVMQAGEVEQVILQRDNSVIRDRLNFLSNNPSDKAGPEIPVTGPIALPIVKSVG